MRNKIRQLLSTALFKETAVYGLTNALFTGLPLLLMPFLVSVMSPAEYGMVDMFRSISMVLIPILGLSTVQAITRFYYDLEEQPFREFCSSIIILHFINALLAIGVLGLVSLFLESKYIVIVFLAILYFLFNQLTEILLIIYRVNKKPKKYLLIRVGCVVLDLLLLSTFYFLYDHYDWTYRVFPNVIAMVAFGVVCLFIMYYKYSIKFTFNKMLFLQAIAFSAPLILHMISGYVLNLGNRFFIIYFLGEEELGNFSVAYKLGMSISFFYTSFNLAWTPTFFEWMKAGKFEAIKKVKKLVFAVLPCIGTALLLGWWFLSKFIPNFAKYNVPFLLIVIIMVSFVILSYYKFKSNYFFYYKNTRKLAVYTLVSAAVSVVLNIILVPKIGLYGAAVTSLVSFMLLFILVTNFDFSKYENNQTNIEK